MGAAWGDASPLFTGIRLKDEDLEESANLPAPGVIAQEIAAALEPFDTIAEDLK